MRFVPPLVLTIVVALSIPATASAKLIHFKASLSSNNEVPKVASAGTGSATATLNTTTRRLSWVVHYSGTTGPLSAAHIHGPAAPTGNAPVVLPFTGNLASPIKGSKILTKEQAAELEAGKYYVNLHTKAHVAGELRGQLEPEQ
jgi:CHRD domain